MNTLKDTLNTLPVQPKALALFVFMAGKMMFRDHQTIQACMFWMPPDAETPEMFPVNEMSDKTKPQVWAAMRKLRETFPVTGFVSECWVSMPKKGDVLDMDHLPMPRNDPNRIERVMFTLWHGSRVLTFYADIIREPQPKLGPWKLFHDTLFPKKGMENLGGAMMEGNHCTQENN